MRAISFSSIDYELISSQQEKTDMGAPPTGPEWVRWELLPVIEQPF